MISSHVEEEIPGWWPQLKSGFKPPTVSFQASDGDFYTSIMESLEGIYPRLSRNAIVVVDDYCDPAVLDVHNILPGVKKACDDFLKDKGEEVTVLICGENQCHGFFRKL